MGAYNINNNSWIPCKVPTPLLKGCVMWSSLGYNSLAKSCFVFLFEGVVFLS